MTWISALGDPLHIWGLFTRLLGIMLAWAIGQLYFQIPRMGGDKGFYPHSKRLKQIRRDFGLIPGILNFPGLLWFKSNETMMRFWIIIGTVAGLAIAAGVPGSNYLFLLCFIIYLSFDLPAGMSYPWDSLLFEATILAIFLPELLPFPEISSVSEPHPAIAFLYRFLLFRLLFGFGKFKFSKPNFKDSGYFKNFLLNVPLPSPLALPVSKLPLWVFRSMYVFAFVAEMIIPFLMFIPGTIRVVAVAFIACLMIGIQLLSNFGFFNVLTIILALPLLDTGSFLWTDGLWNEGGALDIGMILLLLFYLIFGLISLPFNSWCSFTWMHWPSALFLNHSWLRYPVSILRSLSRWRFIHAFGVFPLKSQPPMKLLPLIEGSMDGKEWKRFHYLYTLSHEKQQMPFVAPFHPRIDHFVFYDAFAINNTNFNWSLVGSCIPYDFAPRGGLDNLIEAMLENRGEVKKFFRNDPFPGMAPKFIRAGVYYAVPGKGDTRWDLYLADVHRLPRQKEPEFEFLNDITPELFHWDAYYWRLRTREGKAWKKLSQNDDLDLVLSILQSGIDEETAYLWETFSHKFSLDKADWSLWLTHVQEMESCFSVRERRAIYRYWSRLRIVLGHRLESEFLEKGKKLASGNYYDFGMLLFSLLHKGKQTLQELWKDPKRVHELARGIEPLHGFYTEALFRPEACIDHYRKMLWSIKMVDDQSDEVLPGFERLCRKLPELPLQVSLKAWPTMDYNAVDGEWSLGEAIPPDAVYPQLFQAWQGQIKSPTPY